MEIYRRMEAVEFRLQVSDATQMTEKIELVESSSMHYYCTYISSDTIEVQIQHFELG